MLDYKTLRGCSHSSPGLRVPTFEPSPQHGTTAGIETPETTLCFSSSSPSRLTLGLADVPDAEAMQGWQMGDDGNWQSPVSPDVGDGGALTADVPDFGFWNWDRNFRTACVKVHIESNGRACGGQEVKSSGPDGIGWSDHVDKDGTACFLGAQTFPSQITVGGTSASMQMPSNPGDCDHPE